MCVQKSVVLSSHHFFFFFTKQNIFQERIDQLRKFEFRVLLCDNKDYTYPKNVFFHNATNKMYVFILKYVLLHILKVTIYYMNIFLISFQAV